MVCPWPITLNSRLFCGHNENIFSVLSQHCVSQREKYHTSCLGWFCVGCCLEIHKERLYKHKPPGTNIRLRRTLAPFLNSCRVLLSYKYKSLTAINWETGKRIQRRTHLS